MFLIPMKVVVPCHYHGIVDDQPKETFTCAFNNFMTSNIDFDHFILGNKFGVSELFGSNYL